MTRTILIILLALALTACTAGQTPAASEPSAPAEEEPAASSAPTEEEPAEPIIEEPAFQQITADQAAQMMAEDADLLIVDVRRQDEYAEGHIPGAICVPNESIGTEQPEALPDLEQTLLIYCRSGRRSKEAAGKLAAIGYTHVYDFGGILDWTGEVVTEEPQQEEGQTMQLTIGETLVPVTWEDNEAVRALQELRPLTVQMSMYGGFEQVGPIGRSLPREDEQTVTEAGDIVLYAGDQIVIFYGSNSWSYTRLGHVELSEEEMTDLLSQGNVTITIE